MDGQAGSCGKGKIVGYLSLRDNIDVAINNNMTNAGHTFVFDNGKKVITSHLPISVVNPNTELLIGATAAITPEVLENELIKYSGLIGDRKIYIHPRAMIIQQKHRDYEHQMIRSGSTFKGCGAAQAEKMLRLNGVELIKDYYFKLSDTIKRKVIITDTTDILFNAVKHGKKIIIEGSQGFDLDLNYGLDYPNVTSRQCTAAQMLADCGLPLGLSVKVYMLIRPYPIRISNKTDLNIDINSGEYDGSDEITWDIIKQRCEAPIDVDLKELTTVTKKVRRVFEFNYDRFDKAMQINDPYCVVLNFAQYLNYQALSKNDYFDLPGEIYQFESYIYDKYRDKFVGLIGTGARNCDIVDIETVDADQRYG